MMSIQQGRDILAAIRQCDERLRAEPNNVAVRHQRSDYLKKMGLYHLALSDAERCLELDPNFALGWCNKAFILLALGDYPAGFKAYEWRWKTGLPTFQPPQWGIPEWQGQDIGEAKLLIYAEQGLGDNIQFVRFAIEAKQQGLNVVVVNHTPLEGLLNHNLARYGVDTSPNGAALEGLEYYVSMMSLAQRFSTRLETIPLRSAYLEAEPSYIAKFQQKITACRPKIGIAWAGSAKHDRNAIRSLKMTELVKLFHLNAEFHCLQKEVDEADLAFGKQFVNFHFWHTELEDFSDTAGLVANLDLVISVDTSVAHLAAAMGKPTWIMLAYHPDFRWLTLCHDSPWYENVRLFRQTLNFSWADVVELIYQTLIKK